MIQSATNNSRVTWSVGDLANTASWNKYAGRYNKAKNPAKVLSVEARERGCQSGVILHIEGVKTSAGGLDSDWFEKV